MSSKDVTVSERAQDEAVVDSVYDFLYHDSRRIGSFLSQFDNNGLLTGLNLGESAAVGSRRGYKLGIGGELPLLGGAKVDFERQPVDAGSETLDRSYDPFWTNALTFLDFLSEKNLIKPQIETASLGQFVLARGALTVLDMTMMKDAWQLDTIQRAIRGGAGQDQAPQGNRQQRRSQGQQQQRRNTMPNDSDIALELMQVLPHTVNATITMPDGETLWALLRSEFMVTPASELVLTHGSGIPGQWAMLGILSSRPDIGATLHQQELAQIGSDLPPGLVNSGLGLMMKIMSPIIRTTMGRPEYAYSVTPLLIFREVT